MKNKLRIGQTSALVAFTILIGAVSFSPKQAQDITTDSNELTAGVTLDMSTQTDDVYELTAGAAAALEYSYIGVSVSDNDSDVVTASGSTDSDTQNAAQQCGYTNLGMTSFSDGNLNIREQASTDSEVVGVFTNHNACEIIAVEGEWTQIESGDVSGYVKSEYLLTGDEALAIAEQEIETVAKVNTQTLRVRSEKSTESSILSLVGDSEKLTVTNVGDDGWVEVNVDDETGYVASEYVTIEKDLPTAKTMMEVKYGEGVTDVRVSLVQYALSFVGNRYVWGGTSLTNGVDCSGFTMQIYAKYGVSLPHSSKAQPSYGTKISSSEAQPGDLFFYGSGKSISHVAIYIGNGQIVHASNKRDGIKISNAYYRSPICVVRYL